MLSIYKKEFGENNENSETSANGSPDTLMPSGIAFVTVFTRFLFLQEPESTFHILNHSGNNLHQWHEGTGTEC